MSIKVIFVVLSLFGWFGVSVSEPICSVDDRRYIAGYGFDDECLKNTVT